MGNSVWKIKKKHWFVYFLSAVCLHFLFIFFPTASSSSENGEETTDKPAFRWDGTPLVDKTKESHFLKKVKSMEVESDKNNQQPPKPPIRDSSRKREEIKWKKNFPLHSSEIRGLRST